MKIPGFEGFHKHLPDYTVKQAKSLLVQIPLMITCFFLLQLFFLNLFQYFSRLSGWRIIYFLEAILPIVNNLGFIVGGLLIIRQGFRKKKDLWQINREKSYQNIVNLLFLGASMLFSGILFGFTPMRDSEAPSAIFLSARFDIILGFRILTTLRYIFAATIILLAGRTAFRASQTVGIDTGMLVYLYFPDESKIIDNKIYSILRHPMYSSIILLSFGGSLISFSIYSIIFLLITIPAILTFVIKVEEPELIKRFGDSYRMYMKKTPAVILQPKNIGLFIKFLFPGLAKKRK